MHRGTEAQRQGRRGRVRGRGTRGGCRCESRAEASEEGKGGRRVGEVWYGRWREDERKKDLTATLSSSLCPLFPFFSPVSFLFSRRGNGNPDVWWGVDIARRGLVVLWAVRGQLKGEADESGLSH